MRKLGRPKTLREQYDAANKADKFYAALAGVAPQNQTVIAPKRERAAPNADLSEAGVMRDIADLIAVHPLVAMCVRQNGGAMAYQDSKGAMRPVWFYQFVRRREKMTITDFWGFLTTKQPFCIEAKRRDWSYKGTDREVEQREFIYLVQSMEGRAGFATSAEEARAIIEG